MDIILVITEIRDQIYLNIGIVIYINLCHISSLLCNFYFDEKYYDCIVSFNLCKIS